MTADVERLERALRALDHVRNTTDVPPLANEASLAHTIGCGLAAVIRDRESFEGFVEAFTMDLEEWLAAIERGGFADMLPYYNAEANRHG